MKNKYTVLACVFFLGFSISCKKYLEINNDPNNIKSVPVSQILPSVTVNIGYMGASDLLRYSLMIMQQFSGQGPVSGGNTFKEYERYNINSSDINNQWNTVFATIVSDLELMISQAQTTSPHYAGVGKLLKAYVYQVSVDAWGDVPYTEAARFNSQLYPKFDDDAAIYTDLIKLIDAGVTDLNAATSALEPNSNTSIYANPTWAAAKIQWLKFANTLKLRIYLHYSKKDPAFATQQIAALVSSGGAFMQATTDNFQMPFLSESGRQTPTASIEGGQFKNQFFPHRTIVDMMNAKADPRRATYFVPFPYNSNPPAYKGASILDATASAAYSRIHTYLKGTATVTTSLINADGTLRDGAITYGGNAPSRLLTYAEYNFMRAEAALSLGAAGDPQTFYQEGIRASMKDAVVAQADIDKYVLVNGTLAGTAAQKLEQIINEKYIANYGVMMEPWTDYRRTGYPAIKPLTTPTAIYNEIPRILPYGLNESTSNPNVPARADLLVRVFWDVK